MFRHHALLVIMLIVVTVTLTTAKRARPNTIMTSSSIKHVTSPTYLPAHEMREMRCPRKCSCNSITKEVNCSYRKLTKIPRGIPSSVKRLILTGNKLKFLPNKSFKYFGNLELLQLDGNYIESISIRLLRHLRNLKTLNLGSNQIEDIPEFAFSKLRKLHYLLLRRNKIGKLRLNSFAGLRRVTEIDLSNNLLQTLEMDMFEQLLHLNKLYLQGNKWHCDCHLKTLEITLRKQNVRTGYLVCDSPSKLVHQHLRSSAIDSLCGIDSTSLIEILIGAACGIIVFLFAIYMCRKRAASNIEANDSPLTERESFTAHKRSCSDSSLMSSHSDFTETKKIDLMNPSSSELNVSILSLLSSNKRFCNEEDNQSGSKALLISTFETVHNSPSQSCSVFGEQLSKELDVFTEKN